MSSIITSLRVSRFTEGSACLYVFVALTISKQGKTDLVEGGVVSSVLKGAENPLSPISLSHSYSYLPIRIDPRSLIQQRDSLV